MNPPALDIAVTEMYRMIARKQAGYYTLILDTMVHLINEGYEEVYAQQMAEKAFDIVFD